MKSNSIIGFVVLVILVGCNESFNPKGPFQDDLVVFAVLTTVKDTQYVRLYRTYDPSGFNPLEHTTDNAVVGAQVSVSTDTAVYQFHDTTIVRKDKSRYTNDIEAYVAYPFPVVRGQTYTLNIQTNVGDNINASLTVPSPSTMLLNNSAALQNPRAFRGLSITLNSTLSIQTRGYQIRAFLEYDLLENGVFVPKREEIPTSISDFVDCHNNVPEYHVLERRQVFQPTMTLFDVEAYMATLAKIWSSYPSSDVRTRRVVFELLEFDPALYAYLNVANSFRDEFSIRTDEPDYSNIPGSYGIFGVMAKRSLTVSISDTLGMTLDCQTL